MKQTFTVTVQKWEESECGWGVRPDGYSLHIDDVHRKLFITAYWATMPDEAPSEYSRPSGTPYTTEVELTDEEQEHLIHSHGLRRYSSDYPGNEGPDGWRHTPRKG
jgi:hypothetical protein